MSPRDRDTPEETELAQYLMDWARRHQRRYFCAFQDADDRIVVLRDPNTDVSALLKVLSEEMPGETNVRVNRNIQ